MKNITGLHHVTVLSSDPQKNLDFYSGILGLRLVKKTINFDAPDVYHLYYGDETGSPGTIMTFFPIPGLAKGRKGQGQLTETAFSIRENSLDYWMKRLDRFGIPYKDPQQRFDNEAFIYLEDFDGLGIELVANAVDKRAGYSYGHIPGEHSIKGFHGVSLTEEGYERTAALLTQFMDHKLIGEKGNRFRFSASGNPGDYVDVLCSPDRTRGLSGSGTVHHVAFATANDETQQEAREKLLSAGLNTTPMLDRQYFHSSYFREPGGILFEIATSDIGFEIDEERSELGKSLKLPPWQEVSRPIIEKGLQPIELNFKSYQN